MKIIALLAFLIFIKNILCTPWCKVNSTYSDSNIVTTENEKQFYFLRKYFSGYNLTFGVEHDGETEMPEFHNITQNQIPRNNFTWALDTIEATHTYLFQDSSMAAAVLSENPNSKYGGKPYQEILYGFATNKDVSPELVAKYQLTNEGEEEQCYDIVQLSETAIATSCIIRDKSTPQFDQWKVNITILNPHTGHNTSIQVDSFTDLYGMPENVKLMKYETEKQTYLLNCILFEKFIDQDRKHTYIDVFRYIPGDGEEGLGKLYQQPPIDETVMDKKKLQIADFTVMYNRIFVLDNTEGVFSMQLESDEVEFVEQFNPFDPKYWAIQIAHQGEEYIMTILSSSTISEYRLEYLQTPGPELLYHYETEFIANDAVKMQSTSRYLALKIGSVLMIYDRHMPQVEFLKISDYYVTDFQLLYSNNFIIYNTDIIENFLLDDAYLEVKPIMGSQIEKITFNLTATSTEFGETKQCKLQLNSIINKNRGAKSLWETGLQEINKNTYHVGDWPTIIMLDTDYLGPNLKYDVQGWGPTIKEEKAEEKHKTPEHGHVATSSFLPSQASVLEAKEPKIENIERLDTSQMIADVPRIANLTNLKLKMEDIEFMTLERLTENSFYILYQTKDFKANINLCKVDELAEGRDPEITCNVDETKTIPLDREIKPWVSGHANYTGGMKAWIHVTTKLEIQVHDFGTAQTYDSCTFYQDYDPETFSIEDIAVEHGLMYVLYYSDNNQHINVHRFESGFDLITTLSSETIAGWPGFDLLDKPWHPIQLLTIPEYDNLLLVLNRKLDEKTQEFYTTLIGMKVFAGNNGLQANHEFTIQEKDEFDVYVNSQSLFQVYTNKNQIYEHSLNILNDEGKRTSKREVLLYDETIRRIDFSRSGLLYGYFYVNDDDGERSGQYLNIFRSQEPQVNQLYTQIKLHKSPSEMIVEVFADGINTDTAIVRVDDQLFIYRVPVHPRLEITSVVEKSKKYMEEKLGSVTVLSWDQETKKDRELMIKLVNSGTHIEVDDTNIKELSSKLQFKDNAVQTEIELDMSRYAYGSIPRWSVECEKYCEGDNAPITFSNILEQEIHNIDKQTNIIDLFFDEYHDTLYVLESDRVIGYNNAYEIVMQPISLEIDQEEFTPTQLHPWYDDQDNSLIAIYVVIKQNVFGWVYIVPISFASPQPYSIGEIQLEGVTRPGKSQWDGDCLLIENNQGPNGGVYVFQINFAELSAEKLVYINRDYLDWTSQFYYSTFEIVRTNDTEIDKILIVDQDNYIHAVNYRKELFAKNITSANAKVWHWDFDIAVWNNKLFLTDDTELLSIHVLGWHAEKEEKDGEQISVNVYDTICLTSDTAIYYFSIRFKDDDNASVEESAKAIYNTYGSKFVPHPTIDSNGATFAVSYYNNQTSQLVLAVYDGSFMEENEKRSENDDIPYYVMKGGMIYNNVRSSDKDVNFIFYENTVNEEAIMMIEPGSNDLQAIRYNQKQRLRVQTATMNGVPNSIAISLQPNSAYYDGETAFIETKVTKKKNSKPNS